jgi:hypothetical protein
MKSAKHFGDLDVYQRAMSLVLRMFELTKQFSAETADRWVIKPRGRGRNV